MSIDLKKLINENYIYESVNIEYKRARNELPKDFWKTYSAFANTTGGYIRLIIFVKLDFKPGPTYLD